MFPNGSGRSRKRKGQQGGDDQTGTRPISAEKSVSGETRFISDRNATRGTGGEIGCDDQAKQGAHQVSTTVYNGTFSLPRFASQ